MAVVSIRIRCDECEAEEVIRDSEMDDSPWKINDKYQNSGLCPSCNPVVDVEEVDFEPEPTPIELESLDNIGKKAAKNLSQGGYDTIEAVKSASDEELLDVSWVGEKGLFSLKEAARDHEPQQRWEN